MLHHVPTVELQDRLFAEIARVLRPGAALVASDSLASGELAAHHEDDTYNPVDPSTLPSRLAAAGFVDVQVKTNEFGWSAIARARADIARIQRERPRKHTIPRRVAYRHGRSAN